jgi:replicative DNA helicase
MIDYAELSVSSNKAIERSALCDMLITRRINSAMKPEFFTGEERKLFDSLMGQWITFRQLDIEVIKVGMNEIIQKCLNSEGNSSSKIAIELLRQEYIKRSRGQIIIQNTGIDDHEQGLRKLSHDINNVLHSKSLTDYNHEKEVMILINSLEQEALRGRHISGFSTGINALDKQINGVELGKFYVLGALKKTGKSRLMVSMAIHLAAQGAIPLVNSLEMSSTQLNLCALSSFSQMNPIDFCKTMNEKQAEAFKKGVFALQNLKWHIHRDYTINDLWARADHLKTNKNISVVFVDFLQRLRDERYKGDRVREVENISQELANMSRELNLAIIALSQLRGEAENLPSNEVPSMRFLKESHGIGENADCIMMLHNPSRLKSPYMDGQYQTPEFKILVEQRYGITGETIECAGDLRTCTFCDKSDY